MFKPAGDSDEHPSLKISCTSSSLHFPYHVHPYVVDPIVIRKVEVLAVHYKSFSEHFLMSSDLLRNQQDIFEYLSQLPELEQFLFLKQVVCMLATALFSFQLSSPFFGH